MEAPLFICPLDVRVHEVELRGGSEHTQLDWEGVIPLITHPGDVAFLGAPTDVRSAITIHHNTTQDNKEEATHQQRSIL